MVSKESLDKILNGDIEEFNKVLGLHTESILRSIPLMISKLVQVATVTNGVVKKLYDEHPEFLKYKDIVVSTLQKTESDNPGLGVEEIVQKAIPEIEAKIGASKKISISTPDGRPNIKELDSRLTNNGAL